jgi:hypothetical protein
MSTADCRHCGRPIVNEGGRWVDPEATGDDSVWRETCDSHDTFTAEHEPEPDESWEDIVDRQGWNHATESP